MSKKSAKKLFSRKDNGHEKGIRNQRRLNVYKERLRETSEQMKYNTPYDSE